MTAYSRWMDTERERPRSAPKPGAGLEALLAEAESLERVSDRVTAKLAMMLDEMRRLAGAEEGEG